MMNNDKHCNRQERYMDKNKNIMSVYFPYHVSFLWLIYVSTASTSGVVLFTNYFSLENAKRLPILAHICALFLCSFTGLNNAMVYKNWQIGCIIWQTLFTRCLEQCGTTMGQRRLDGRVIWQWWRRRGLCTGETETPFPVDKGDMISVIESFLSRMFSLGIPHICHRHHRHVCVKKSYPV